MHHTIEDIGKKLDDHIEIHKKDIEEINRKLDKSSALWWKVALTVLVPVCLGLVAYGSLTQRVTDLTKDVEKKADSSLVSSQLANVLETNREIKQSIMDLRAEIKSVKK